MAQPQDVAALIARSKVLVNPVLKKICKAEGRVQTGVKAQLQSRVIDIINTAAAAQDHDALQRLRYRLENNGEAPPPNGTITAPATFIPQYGSPTANGVPPVMPGAYGAHRSYGARTLPAPGGPPRIFKPSPFYDVLETIVGNIVLEASPQHRKTLPKTLQLSGPLGDRMRQDPSLKLMLFSSGEDSSLSAYQLHNIAFPQQFQVKINGDEVQANWKGLKNKPGSTRPADITDNVRKSPANYRNTMEITYALTQKKYTMHVYLVRKHGVGELAKRITERNVITKQAVLEELKRKANDPDIVVGSVNMGLKDPVSTMRISIPCRSTVCSHLQCFDAECFLQLQEQAPTWTCPICSKTVSYESLAVDQ
jgi:E3 SUMO-protein ligase PIAS1